MKKFIIGQTGIPRHSAVAKLLYKENLLDKFIVDTYFSTQSIWAKLPVVGPKLVNSLKKYDPGFPSSYVDYDWYGSIRFRKLLKDAKTIEAFKFLNKRLGGRLIEYAKDKTPGKYFGFDTVSLGFLEWSHTRGWKGYLEQCVAPRASQMEMLQLFRDKYSYEIGDKLDYVKFQQDVERKEWEYSTKIIVPSNYVKNELRKDATIDINKVHVVNYGYTPTNNKEQIRLEIERKFESKEPRTFRILFAGNAGYRKGLLDILAIAEALKDENVVFSIAGALEAEVKKLIEDYPHKNLVYLGKLPKEKLEEQYRTSDIFFFPSYLEGSALVLIEAMSWGLPIVTTNQSGSVIEDGVHGFICEAGDEKNLQAKVVELMTDADLRHKMSINALDASSDYSVEAYGLNLLKVLND